MGLSVQLAGRREVIAGRAVKARASSRELVARLVALVTPARKAAVAIVVGVVLVVWGLALWSITVALVTAGISLVVYGAVLVDLDVSPPRRKRKKKVVTE